MGPFKTNRQILSRGSDIYERKKFKTHGVEEVSFDRSAREDYLTGFHKRKVARKEKAAEYAKKKAHEEHLAERKQMREERKQTLAADLERFNKAMKDVGELDSDWDDDENTPKKTKKQTRNEDEEESSDYSDWEGPEEGAEANGDNSPSGILKRKQYFQAEDIDEEDTTVVIEEMEEANANFVFPEKSVAVLKESLKKASFAARQAAIYGFPEPSIYRDDNDEDEEDESDNEGESSSNQKKRSAVKPKQKKKKFRYLTKTERKQNVSKERGRSKEKRTRGKR